MRKSFRRYLTLAMLENESYWFSATPIANFAADLLSVGMESPFPQGNNFMWVVGNVCFHILWQFACCCMSVCINCFFNESSSK